MPYNYQVPAEKPSLLVGQARGDWTQAQLNDESGHSEQCDDCILAYRFLSVNGLNNLAVSTILGDLISTHPRRDLNPRDVTVVRRRSKPLGQESTSMATSQ